MHNKVINEEVGIRMFSLSQMDQSQTCLCFGMARKLR